ncbi:hypothetical protein [Methylomonas methanica]|uniref:Osmotically inducible lipoprotein OsmE n=1 Tax=Methylomonas methanica (strain DSM 25384 / MC09) TaxID=857087 RepID=F9ZV19_METMM|nr:hypothetical protein [Methylomonas methanica]AEF99452.1 hypothetical protein Metme_1016 [Methylomonas methanica MC09]
MKKAVLGLTVFILVGCGASELKQSLAEVRGQNIEVIRTYPTSKLQAINGNTVYSYAQNSKQGTPCEIFFEVNEQNVIVETSYKGQGCNAFYNDTLKQQH